MNDRERLMELIFNIWLDTMSEKEYPPTAAEIADHLIANGVTIQKHGRWISSTDCSNAGVYCSECHKKVYKEDYAWCNRKNKLRSNYCPNCGAKMEENHD